MPEPSYKTFNPMADRLFRRGAAAASAGHRTVAAGLLRQAVRLNPGHEQAWLWLSGVLDDPGDIRFCLQTALELNPANERARQGLAQIDAGGSPEDVSAAAVRRRQAAFAPAPLSTPTPWWLLWRDARVVWRGATLLLWLIPCILLLCTGILRLIIINQPLPAFALAHNAPVVTQATVIPSLLAELTATPSPTPSDTLEVATYLTQTQTIRKTLREATATFRTASAQSATRVERVTATNTLKTVIEQQQQRLAALAPPARLQSSHTSYLQGLDLERRALTDMLSFYGSNDLTAANRATVYLQDARLQIEAGKRGLDAAQSTSALSLIEQEEQASPTPSGQ